MTLRKLPQLICLLLALNTLVANAQLSTIDQVNSTTGAEEFIEKNPSLKAEIINVYSGRDSTEWAIKLLQTGKGKTARIGKDVYRIFDEKDEVGCRCSYIFLDGGELSLSQINKNRELIIASYKNGTPFKDLASKYNMDANPTGELMWFAKGTMMRDF